MAEFGRGIYVHMVLLQLKQEHTEQSAQAASKVLQDRHSTTSGQPIPVFHHLRSIEVLPEIQSDPHVFHFSDIVPCFISGNTKKNPAPFSLLPPFRYLCRLIESLLSCFFSRLYTPSFLRRKVLQALCQLHHPSLDTLSCVLLSLRYCGAQNCSIIGTTIYFPKGLASS